MPEDISKLSKEDQKKIMEKSKEIKKTVDELSYKHKQNTNEINKLSKSNSISKFLEYLEITEDEYIKIIQYNINRPTLFLKRNLDELRINSYNKLILQLMKCNIDVQFILDPYACVGYIINYIGKSQGELSKLIRDTANEVRRGNFTLQKQLRSIVNTFINKTEISSQEVAYHILSLPLSHSFTKVIYINTSPPQEGTRMLKSKRDLKQLNPESEDIMENNLLDYYVARPDKLESMCLADFAAHCEYYKKQRKRNYDFENENENDDNIVENEEDEEADNTGCDDLKEFFSTNDIDLKAEYKLQNKMGFQRFRKLPKVIRYRNYKVVQDETILYIEQLMLFTN